MFKFKSRLEIADEVFRSYDNEELFTRFNDYCDRINDPYSRLYYNDNEFLSMFSKDEIANYASYKYKIGDPYVRLTAHHGFESSCHIRDILRDYEISDMIDFFLDHDDYDLHKAYVDYLEDLVEDEDISIRDWAENFLFYYDNEKANRTDGIYCSHVIMSIWTESFPDIYNRSNQKDLKIVHKLIKDRTDVFPDDFIEANLYY